MRRNRRQCFDELFQYETVEFPFLCFMMNGVTLTGSGGGWNTTLSLKANFYDIIKMIQENANRTQPTGFTSDNRYVPVLYVSTY